MICSARLHLDVASLMTSHETTLHAFWYQSLETVRNEPQNDILISASEEVLEDESELWSGEVSAEGNGKVPF